MALHFPPIRSPHSTPSLPSPRSTTAGRALRAPESTPLPTFRSIAASANSKAPSAPAAASDSWANFQALFNGVSSHAPAAAAPQAQSAPTAEDVFGSNPWVANPTGMAPDGSIYGYNPQYFATPETAAAVARMVGGTVVPVNLMTSAPGSTFMQQQPNLMVQLKNGALINPGLVAGFYTHGYPQSMVNQMIANEIANVSA